MHFLSCVLSVCSAYLLAHPHPRVTFYLSFGRLRSVCPLHHSLHPICPLHYFFFVCFFFLSFSFFFPLSFSVFPSHLFLCCGFFIIYFSLISDLLLSVPFPTKARSHFLLSGPLDFPLFFSKSRRGRLGASPWQGRSAGRPGAGCGSGALPAAGSERGPRPFSQK